MHTRAESTERRGETMVGAKESATFINQNKNTAEKHAEHSAA
jgi:hypothetical protein